VKPDDIADSNAGKSEEQHLAAINTLIKSVEHDIINPLSVIVNWAELYREDEAIDPELKNKFQVIYEMALRITASVKRLADLKNLTSTQIDETNKS
jgi:K+-sensing histidine kinase KdpD